MHLSSDCLCFWLVSLDIDSVCSEFDNGSSLHIAASNLAFEAVKVLLQNGADALLKDDLGRTALGKTLCRQIRTMLVNAYCSLVVQNGSDWKKWYVKTIVILKHSPI